jgi:hypothetical protein
MAAMCRRRGPIARDRRKSTRLQNRVVAQSSASSSGDSGLKIVLRKNHAEISGT